MELTTCFSSTGYLMFGDQGVSPNDVDPETLERVALCVNACRDKTNAELAAEIRAKWGDGMMIRCP